MGERSFGSLTGEHENKSCCFLVRKETEDPRPFVLTQATLAMLGLPATALTCYF